MLGKPVLLLTLKQRKSWRLRKKCLNLPEFDYFKKISIGLALKCNKGTLSL